jgi:ribosome biogenesis GTPase / thiamine phosphate phosphatase
MSKRRKGPREKDLTGRFLSGDLDEDRVDQSQRFGARSGKQAQQDKIVRTALLRADKEGAAADLESLPVGEVRQVFSLFTEVEHEGVTTLCVVSKTTAKLMETGIVVGDHVKFRKIDAPPEERVAAGDRPEGVVEQVLRRATVLTRADSFKAQTAHPIVANAEQMLVVVSLRLPVVKWGLVDRMIVAALAGRLRPMICLNKIDLATGANGSELPKDLIEARAILDHYRTLGVPSFEASVVRDMGLNELRQALAGKTTVLAGHSGVGKSSLVRAIQPQLDLRIGAISGYTNKGRHTTTSARHYPLDFGGAVIDTPGVKLFGLWGVTRENLDEFFPDVAAGTAPDWRRVSYNRILGSLPEP